MNENKDNRRNFIKKSLLLSAFTGFFNQKNIAKPLNNTTSLDKWNKISEQFNIRSDITFLNNGTLGPLTNYTRKAVEDDQYDYSQTLLSRNYHVMLAKKIAGFFNISENEVALTKNVSEGNNIAAWAIPLKKGDEIITTLHEHVGNAMPWINRAKQSGAKLIIIDLGKNGAQTIENLKAAITRKTKVISLPHLPCTVGTILPIKEICDIARKKDIFTCIDGAHSAGMLNLDISSLGCDIYSTCFHKWMLGPQGIGFVYINKNILPKINTMYVGAYSDLGWDFRGLKLKYDGINPSDANRYAYGTQNRSLQFGAAASIDFMNNLGMEEVANRVKYLGDYMYEGLQSFGKKIEILTSTEKDERGGIIGFRPKTDYKKIAIDAQNQGIVIRSVPESGINCIRVSTHIYNSKADIDRFLKFLENKI